MLFFWKVRKVLKENVVLASTIMVLSLVMIGEIIFERKNKAGVISLIINILISIIFSVVASELDKNTINNILKILILYGMFTWYYLSIYQEDLSKTITAAFVTYLVYFISEVIIDIPLYIYLRIFDINAEVAQKIVLVNILISAMAVVIAYLKRQKLKEIINNSKGDYKVTILFCILILLTISIILFAIPVSKLKFDMTFVILMILLILFCVIGFILIKQRIKTTRLLDDYSKLANYSKNNEGLLEEYRENLHETKNQLILIDSMVPKKYKDVHEYIATLLEKNKKKKYYFLNDLKNIPLNELKGFMNFKIIEMINQKVNVEVNVSKEIKKTFFKNFKTSDKDDLYSIIGVLLDNARDAALECKNKTVSIEIFMMNNDLKIIIANTYKGTVDLSKIDDYGYTTKGQNHGTGLHIVNRIIKKNDLFDKETQILDNFFTQIVTIHKK